MSLLLFILSQWTFKCLWIQLFNQSPPVISDCGNPYERWHKTEQHKEELFPVDCAHGVEYPEDEDELGIVWYWGPI